MASIPYTAHQAFKVQAAASYAELRPCTLVLNGEHVPAAEGTAKVETRPSENLTGFAEVRTCTFRIQKKDLDTEPVQGAVFYLEGQSRKKWRIINLIAGRSVHDVQWVISCEEYRHTS